MGERAEDPVGLEQEGLARPPVTRRGHGTSRWVELRGVSQVRAHWRGFDPDAQLRGVE